MRKMRFSKKLCVGTTFLLLAVTMFAGCYSFEEKVLEKEYKKQAKVNAVNYIKEKYGFEAKVKRVSVPRFGEFDPFPYEMVFVTMEWENAEFGVKIAGDVVTSEGFDNYQQEEILSALKDEMDTLLGLPSEEVLAVYGDEESSTKNVNGLVAPYFTGDNLNEILTGGYVNPRVLVTYINQEIAKIDIEEIKEQTGIEQFLFVDYDSKEHYETIAQSGSELAGTSWNRIWNLERNLPYINEYLMTDPRETAYVNCEKKIVDGILFVTEYPEETVSVKKIEKLTSGYGKNGPTQMLDIYELETESNKVHVYVPVDKLYSSVKDLEEVEIVAFRKFGTLYVSTYPTDDGKYLGTTIYTRNYDGPIEFSVFEKRD